MHVCFATPAPGHSTLLCELLLYHRKTIPGPWRPPPQLSSRCPWCTVEPRGSSACASSAPWLTAGPRLPLRRRPHAPPALRLLSVRSAIDEAYLMRETIIGHQSRSEALRGTQRHLEVIRRTSRSTWQKSEARECQSAAPPRTPSRRPPSDLRSSAGLGHGAAGQHTAGAGGRPTPCSSDHR